MIYMQLLDLIDQLKQEWLIEIEPLVTSSDVTNKLFASEMSSFYDLFACALKENQVAPVIPLLEQWCISLAEINTVNTNLSLSEFISQLFIITNNLIIHADKLRQSSEVINNLLLIEFNILIQIGILEKNIEINSLNAQMRQYRIDLEKLDKSKSDFISVAAHELKTPLTLIEGYAAMLHEVNETSRDPETIELLLSGMDQGSKRLKRIVDDMIDVSLIDNRLLTLNFQPVWINRLLLLLVEEFLPITYKRSQKIIYIDFPGSDELIFADAERIMQAFRNLILNSIKYTPDGGTITVSGRLLPGYLEITFADTGIGIAHEDQIRIFDKFHRIGNPSFHSSGNIKFKGGGPGLGLSITKGIIEAHGGTLWVDSDGCDEEKLPGSTFHILIPVRKVPPDEHVAKLFKPLFEE
jgi:signal transduction histidine kinase